MKVLTFPTSKKWNGKGLKKKHTRTAYKETEADIYKAEVIRLDGKIDTMRYQLKKLELELVEAKRRYYQAEEDAK
jgi:hypothetical protein